MKIKIILKLILITACVHMAKAEKKINITIDDRTMSAVLAENNATKALIEKLTEGPVTITMKNYGGFEKVGALPWSLPTSDSNITTRPGDIMLYTGNNIVIFYGENTWAYTPIGILDTSDAEEIRNFVGNGNKQVTISLDNISLEHRVENDRNFDNDIYTLNGVKINSDPLQPGIYVKNNRKIIVKR